MILGACEHPGGATTLAQVAGHLRQAGHEVKLIAGTEIAAKTLQGINEPFERFDSAKAVLAQYPHPDALLTSMCSTKGIIAELIRELRGVCPRISLQGAGGGGSEVEWLDPKIWPDYLCVQDFDAQAVFWKRWQGFDKSHVLVTGLPILDRWIGYDVEKAKQSVRSGLGLSDDWFVVLFAGQVEKTSVELLELVYALNSIGKYVCLIAREHPRFRTGAPEEVGAWEGALEKFRSGIVLGTGSWKDSTSLVAAANVVVGRTSNMLVEAASLFKPVVAIILPSVTEELERTTGRNIWPWAENGTMAKVTTQAELREALERAFRGELNLKKGQERAFPQDGKPSGKRVAEFVTELLPKH